MNRALRISLMLLLLCGGCGDNPTDYEYLDSYITFSDDCYDNGAAYIVLTTYGPPIFEPVDTLFKGEEYLMSEGIREGATVLAKWRYDFEDTTELHDLEYVVTQRLEVLSCD